MNDETNVEETLRRTTEELETLRGHCDRLQDQVRQTSSELLDAVNRANGAEALRVQIQDANRELERRTNELEAAIKQRDAARGHLRQYADEVHAAIGDQERLGEIGRAMRVASEPWYPSRADDEGGQ